MSSFRGVCLNCNSRLLLPNKLSPERFDTLRSAVIEHAFIRKDIFFNSDPPEVATFEKFLERHQGFDMVVDGLNVAYLGGSTHQNRNMRTVAKRVRYSTVIVIIIGKILMLVFLPL